VGIFLIEIASLSRLTGDPVYEKAAMRAMNSMWQRRSEINLIGNNINVELTCLNAIIGSGVDSYFEYLVKAGILPDNPELINRFQVNRQVPIARRLVRLGQYEKRPGDPAATRRGLAGYADPDWRREKAV